MVLLLGATGYIGQAFARALRRRKDAFIPLSLGAFDYTRFDDLFDYVRKVQPELLINAEERGGLECWNDGLVGTEGNAATEGWSDGVMKAGSADLNHLSNAPAFQHSRTPAESERMEILQANTVLPQTIAHVCDLTRTPWGHVSSGSIYFGAKTLENGNIWSLKDLGLASIRRLFAAYPERFRGFTELDEPNFSFRAGPCTFFSGSKALAEEALRGGQNYIWRLRLPFNEQDDPANFLSQILHAMSHGATHSGGPVSHQRQSEEPAAHDHDILHDAINSLSQVDECVGACLELWDRRAPYGIYNVANPGAACNHDIIRKIQRNLKPVRPVHLVVYENTKVSNGEKTRRSNCILDVSKILRTGIKLRPVDQAIDKALQQWETAKTGHREIRNA